MNELSKSKVCGTLLNEVFSFINVQKQLGAKGLKLSMPLGLRFEIEGLTIDTAVAHLSFQQKLKLQNTAKGRKRFANNFMIIFNYITAQRVEVSLSEVFNKLDKEIEMEEMKAANNGVKGLLSAAA